MLCQNIERDHTQASFSFDVDRVEDFIASEDGAAWLKSVAKDLYFERFSPVRDWCPTTLKKLAAVILESDEAGISNFMRRFASDPFEHVQSMQEEVERQITDLFEEHEVEFDEETVTEWFWSLEESLADMCLELDDSKPADLFSGYETAEVMFSFYERDTYDNEIYRDRDFHSLTRPLQRQLAAIGFTIGDYRRIMGCKDKAYDRLPSGVVRSQKLLSDDELRTLLENSGSCFEIGIYAIVSIEDLLAYKPNEAFILDTYSILSIDEMNGVHYFVRRDSPIILRPGIGHLRAITGYTPDESCGLIRSCFLSKLHQRR